MTNVVLAREVILFRDNSPCYKIRGEGSGGSAVMVGGKGGSRGEGGGRNEKGRLKIFPKTQWEIIVLIFDVFEAPSNY